MIKATTEAILAAASRVSEEDLTEEGVPKMAALNAILRSEGFQRIVAADRDAALETLKGNVATVASEKTLVRLEKAHVEPLPLTVNGVALATLRAGRTTPICKVALAALKNTNAIFTILENEQ